MNSTKSSIAPEKITLFSINIFTAGLDTEEHFLENPQPVDHVQFEVAHSFEANEQEKICRFRLWIDMKGVDDKSNPLGVEAYYGIEFQFLVENFSDFIVSSEKTKMEVQLPLTLLSIAYSTARGIIYERTRGTYFQGILLPVVNPDHLLKEGSIMNQPDGNA